MENTKVVEYAHIIIKLLQDVVYDEEKAVWSDLLTFQIPIRDYLAKIGLELLLDEREGFAFIRQADDEDQKLPRLVRRIPLSYEVTLLCVILREILEEFDIKDVESRKCFVTTQELRDKIEIFFKDSPNMVRLLERFDKTIQTTVRLGFLKETDQDNVDPGDVRYEVRRVIKAKITSEKLEEIKQKLSFYTDVPEEHEHGELEIA